MRDRRSGHARPGQALTENIHLFPANNGSASLLDPPQSSMNSVSPVRLHGCPQTLQQQQQPTWTSISPPLPADPPLRTMSVSGSGNELEESDEDDPLESAALMQPLRMLTDREEAARLRAEGHYGGLQRRTQTPALAPDHSDRQQHPIHDIVSDRPQKRPRRETHSDHIREKGDLSRSFRDPVALGYCGEERAKQLFQL